MGRDEKGISKGNKSRKYLLMIFVTVGTHEQGFDRLLIAVDRLVESGFIHEDVYMQTGYSKYKPTKCKYSQFLEYSTMQEMLTTSTIVITHGGPSTFMIPVSKGIKTIVMPRMKEHNEHVNNHQQEFCQRVVEEGLGIILVDSQESLMKAIVQDASATKTDQFSMPDESHIKVSRTESFVEKFEKKVNELMYEKE